MVPHLSPTAPSSESSSLGNAGAPLMEGCTRPAPEGPGNGDQNVHRSQEDNKRSPEGNCVGGSAQEGMVDGEPSGPQEYGGKTADAVVGQD